MWELRTSMGRYAAATGAFRESHSHPHISFPEPSLSMLLLELGTFAC
jgi:hypothetical protein